MSRKSPCNLRYVAAFLVTYSIFWWTVVETEVAVTCSNDNVDLCVAQTLLSLSKLAVLAVPDLSDDLVTNVDGMCIVLLLYTWKVSNYVVSNYLVNLAHHR